MLPKKKVRLNESPEIHLIWRDEAVQLLLEKKKSSKNHKYTYYNLLLHISLLQGSRVQFFLYHLRNSSEAY